MKYKTAITVPIFLLLAVFLSVACLPQLGADETISDISGTYTRQTENESANLEISLLPGGKVHIEGMAFWGTRREYGPNIGELDFTAPFVNNHIRYSEQNGQTITYTLELIFTETGLTAREKGLSENLGLNVSFAGDYQKTEP